MGRRFELGEVLEVARTGDHPAFQRAALEYLEHAIGFDVATVLHRGLPGEVKVGFRNEWWADFEGRRAVYALELAEFERATISAGGVGVDREFFGSTFERTAYYQELVAPEHGMATMYGILVFGGEAVGAVLLGRRRKGFRAVDRKTLRLALPAITVSELAFRAAPIPRPAIPLTPRERDIVDYLRLGCTNADIALALGTSVHTVRNQLARLYRKLGASNRAEVVSVACGAGAAATD